VDTCATLHHNWLSKRILLTSFITDQRKDGQTDRQVENITPVASLAWQSGAIKCTQRSNPKLKKTNR